ncbi:hypothetical protein [Microvirga brassicacearum]|uniref:hypothetical protein n=1 Tax=Microvirga brassicacearum TaxID=2580413 RepID=UPI0030842BFE
MGAIMPRSGERLLGPAFLDETHDGIDDHDRDDHGGVDEVTQQEMPRQRRRAGNGSGRC